MSPPNGCASETPGATSVHAAATTPATSTRNRPRDPMPTRPRTTPPSRFETRAISKPPVTGFPRPTPSLPHPPSPNHKQATQTRTPSDTNKPTGRKSPIEKNDQLGPYCSLDIPKINQQTPIHPPQTTGVPRSTPPSTATPSAIRALTDPPRPPQAPRISSTNASNRYPASCGPGDASG